MKKPVSNWRRHKHTYELLFFHERTQTLVIRPVPRLALAKGNLLFRARRIRRMLLGLTDYYVLNGMPDIGIHPHELKPVTHAQFKQLETRPQMAL